MKVFEGKTPEERNKLIAAIVLGAMALIALTYTFGGMFFGGSKKPAVTVSVSPTPKASPTGGGQNAQSPEMPNQEAVNFEYTTTPVVYNPGSFYAPDPGRNIFAFYEPPLPTPYSPTPTPAAPVYVEPPTPTPTPTPPILIAMVTPQNVYAGAKAFRLEVNGNDFTPDSRIIFNGNELPTTYVSPQKLVADIPAMFISNAGTVTITVNTPGGLYSNQITFEVQPPPTPALQYIGMIARRRYNNDTAYFQEQGKPNPISARLNDVVGGRFRLISISADETIFEDVNLGFRHKLALYRPAPGEGGGATGNQGVPGLNSPTGFPNPRGNTQYNQYNQYNTPTTVPTYITPQGDIPGIPNSIPRATPPPPPPDNDIDDDGDN